MNKPAPTISKLIFNYVEDIKVNLQQNKKKILAMLPELQVLIA